jgi:acetyltransferase-like isoleucine patch superfamily enzyme
VSGLGITPDVLTIGRATYFVPVVHVGGSALGHVTIGNYSSIAQDVEILLDHKDAQRDNSHGPVPPSSLRGDRASGRPADVTIGSDVWCASGAKIFPGLTIGDGAVVAAWSVVTADVEPFTIVAGNPAREIGRRFDEETVEVLLRMRWWDWPEEIVTARWQELCSPDVSYFVARHDPRRTNPSSDRRD